jgi:hypothetical protein
LPMALSIRLFNTPLQPQRGAERKPPRETAWLPLHGNFCLS